MRRKPGNKSHPAKKCRMADVSNKSLQKDCSSRLLRCCMGIRKPGRSRLALQQQEDEQAKEWDPADQPAKPRRDSWWRGSRDRHIRTALPLWSIDHNVQQPVSLNSNLSNPLHT